MTFCNHCGKPVPDNAAFCPGCGSRLTPAAPNGAYNSNAQQQPRVQVPQVQTPPTQQYNAPPAPDFTKPQALPMNYYKFAIWVQLFLGALVYAVQGLGLLFGFWYEAVSGINAQWFYLFFPAMHIVDILFGLLYLAMAVGAVYTRQQMAHFKKNGPDLYLPVPDRRHGAVVPVCRAAGHHLLDGQRHFQCDRLAGRQRRCAGAVPHLL